MNHLFIKLSGLVFVLAMMFSCTTDFETTAPYKDITIVYGLLDQTQADQYIKINKAYLSETDVLTYANNADSNNYPYVLDIKLEEWDENDNLVKTFGFDTTTIYNKEPGQFYNPEQVLYKWIGPDYPLSYEVITWGTPPTAIDSIPKWLNTDHFYKLVINDPVTGKLISSETNMVDNFTIERPLPFSSSIKFVSNQNNTRQFEWKNADNAAKYEIEMLFHYYEVNGSADTTETYIKVWSQSENAQQGDSDVSVTFSDDQFFSACSGLIPYPDAAQESLVIIRISSFIELKISAAEESFSLYLEVNEPSTSIVQDKPQFSNVENGLGIFSSRAYTKTYKKVHPESMQELIALYPYLKFNF